MQWFLNKQEYADPLMFGYVDAASNAKDFAKLKAKQILKHTDTLQELPCPFCDEEHQVGLRENDGNILLLCQQGGGKELIDAERVKLYTVDTNRWLQLIQTELLGLIFPLPAVTERPGLYYLGQIKKAGGVGTIDIYYSQRSQVDQQILEAQANKVILLNVDVARTDNNFAIFSLTDFLLDVASKKFFNRKVFMERVQHAFRRIHFNEQNGNIYDGDSLIASLNVGSPQYYFFKLLWDKWEQPVSHEEVTKYITGQIGKKTDQTYQDYANSLKFKLVKEHPKLDQFIINKTGFYLLSDTAEKKSVRKTRK